MGWYQPSRLSGRCGRYCLRCEHVAFAPSQFTAAVAASPRGRDLAFSPLLHEHGLTEQQWRIIRTLLERGPLEPRELVQICQISSPSLTGILARMTDTGWIARERLAHDQRRVRISLTAQSQTLARCPEPRKSRRSTTTSSTTSAPNSCKAFTLRSMS